MGCQESKTKEINNGLKADGKNIDEDTNNNNNGQEENQEKGKDQEVDNMCADGVPFDG